MKIIIITLLSIALVGCTSSATNEDEINKIPKVTPELIVDEIQEKIDTMSLDEKIAQMLFIEYRQTSEYDDTLQTMIKEYQPGGFILFSENMNSYEQTLKLINSIKQDSNTPIFIGVDQEGGRVQRVNYLSDVNMSDIPAMLDVGDTQDTNLAYQIGEVIAEELSTFGFNLDFAPSLDIFSNPKNTVIGDRAFGHDAQTVSTMGLALASGLQSRSIIPVYKHFPGHGDTLHDSHEVLPIITKTKAELYDLELLPFIDAINNDAEVIMIGHLALPNITGNYMPASLSKEIISDLLKDELGFNGLVITDALDMGALTNNHSQKEIILSAVNAGADILLMPGDIEDVINIIKNAIEEETISEKQINTSVYKILTLKSKCNLTNDTLDANPSIIRNQEHQDILNQLQ